MSVTSWWRGALRTDLFRILASGAISAVIAVAVVIALVITVDLGADDPTETVVTSYVVVWPAYTLIYVTWGYRVYSRLDSASLQRAGDSDDRGERRLVQRILGVTGATNTTISAAVAAVIVTIAIAQRPDFRGAAIYIVLTLLTVASSWMLMVFSFAQSYLRLGAGKLQEPHLVFHFPGTARFSDYFTLAVLVSTMAVTLSAEVRSRRAWRILRTNVVIAFVFNSVIIAMMVSLLFGGLLG